MLYIAIIPAVMVTAIYGEKGTGAPLVLSQVILSLQLSSAVVPLVRFTSSRVKMGVFVNKPLNNCAGIDRRPGDRSARPQAADGDRAGVAGMTARLLLTLVMLAAPLVAQGRTPIETDRPDFTESSATIPRGRFQLEAGYTLQSSHAGRTGHSLPETLLRIGLTSGIELRVAQSAVVRDGRSALEDISLGTKLGLAEQRGARPQLAVLFASTVPTGGDGTSAEIALPSASLLAGWEIGERWSLGSSAIAGRGEGDHLELAGSVVAGYALNDAWRGYAEWFTIQPVQGGAGVRGESYLNGGLAHLLSPVLQLDARAGVGVGGAADRFFAGLGLSVRW